MTFHEPTPAAPYPSVAERFDPKDSTLGRRTIPHLNRDSNLIRKPEPKPVPPYFALTRTPKPAPRTYTLALGPVVAYTFQPLSPLPLSPCA